MNIVKELDNTKSVEMMKDLILRFQTHMDQLEKEFLPKEYNAYLSSLIRKFYVEEYIELLTSNFQSLLKKIVVRNSYPYSTILQILNYIRVMERKEDKEKDIVIESEVGVITPSYRRFRNIMTEIVLSANFPSLAFEEYLKMKKHRKFELSQDQFLRVFVTIPDRIVGIKNSTFYSKLTRKFFSSLEKYLSSEISLRNEFESFLITFLSLLSNRGYSDLVCFETINASRKFSNSVDFMVSFLRKWNSRGSNVSKFSKFVFGLLEIVSQLKEPWKYYRTLFETFLSILKVKSRTKQTLAKLLCVEAFLPKRKYHLLFFRSDQTSLQSQCQVLQTFLALLIVRSGLANQALEQLLSLWKQDNFVKFTPQETQEGVTRMILFLFHLCEKEKIEIKNKYLLQRIIMDGVNIRLDITIVYVRKHAILLAEKFSELLHQKTEFDEFKGEKNKIEEFFDGCVDSFTTRVLLSEKEGKIGEKPKDENGKVEEKKKKEKMKKEKKKKEIDPDESIFDNDEESTSESSEEEEESDGGDSESEEDEGEVSDVDSLESFGLDNDDAEDEELKQKLRSGSLKPPTFIRDLIPLITAGTDDDHCVEKIEMGLKYIEKMVRARPEDLDVVSKRLARYMLYLNDPYSIAGFMKYQTNGLVSLLVCSTKPVSRFLIGEFFQPRRGLNKRSLILTVLRLSAMELSNRDMKEIEKLKKKSKETRSKEEEKAREALRKKYQGKGGGKGKTRIWGRFGKKVEIMSKKNSFLDHAESYFYPLLSNYDSDGRVFRMISGENFLFSEYLTTLTSCVFCCGNHYIGFKLASSLLEFLWFIKYHFKALSSDGSSGSGILGHLRIKKEEDKEPSFSGNAFMRKDKNARTTILVRRTVLHALLVVVDTIPDHIIMEHETRISEFVEWLIQVEKNDPDDKSREFAVLVLATLREKLDFL